MPNVYEEIMNVPTYKYKFSGCVEVSVIRVVEIKCKIRVGGSASEELKHDQP